MFDRTDSHDELFSCETSDLIDLMSRRIELQYRLKSDRYVSRHKYRPPRSSSVVLPRISFSQHRSRFVSSQTPTETLFFFPSSTFPSNSFRRKPMPWLCRRWKIIGFILIFYFHLRKKLRLAKRFNVNFEHDYFRIRSFELLTAAHREYLEPTSLFYRSLSMIISNSLSTNDQTTMLRSVQLIIDGLTKFLPSSGVLGTNSEDSVFLYLLHCSLNDYSSTYHWKIERHLLTLSYRKMEEHGRTQLDHFTTKFLLISSLIFRCLNKTLLFKPVKYRLIRGEINPNQSLNIRIFSTIILYLARHAIMHKKEDQRLPMPFPIEMKNHLLDDQRLQNLFANDLDQLLKSEVPKISVWASEYADRLQKYSHRILSRRETTFISDLK